MEPETTAKSNNSLKVILGLSIALNVALLIWAITLNNQNKEKAEQIVTLTAAVDSSSKEVTSKTSELEQVRGDLERIKEESEKLGLKNDSLDAQLVTLNSYIAKLKKNAKIDAKERKKMEELVAQLREQIIQKDQEIAQLKQQNDSLSTNLSTVTGEKQKLGDSLSNTSKELKLASVLKADNITVIGIKENGKELIEKEYKHNKLDRIKITFTLADNKAAKKNSKNFYVSLVTPSGNVFSDPNNGGGTTTLADGTDVTYTLSQSLTFDNTNQQVTVTMLKGFNYTPGTYTINVYAEGYQIGAGKFIVK